MRLTAFLTGATAALCLAATHAGAATVEVVVNSQAGPWQALLNPSFDYGSHNEGPSASVLTGFDFTAGGVFTITYLSGLTSAFGNRAPYSDGVGDVTFLTNNFNGNSGHVFPSFYIDHSQYPAYLNALIGTFADSAGHVVGTPFLVGNEPYNVAAPVGAAQILLGINDDIFPDNSGALYVEVSGPSAAPEPATWTLMIVGFGLAGAVMRRRRTLPA